MDDPASGELNTSHKLAAARREAEVGLAAERQGLLEGPVRRAGMDYSDPSKPKDLGDFIDATGQRWDVKGFRDTYPPTAGPMAGKPFPPGFKKGFNLENVERSIRRELGEGEKVLLDFAGLPMTENKKSIMELLKNNTEWDGKVFIIDV